jgi:hypothetical protein
VVFQGSFVTKVTPLPHRHGRIRVYFRRDKCRRIALPSTIGSDEFRAAYQAAITSQRREAGTAIVCAERSYRRFGGGRLPKERPRSRGACKDFQVLGGQFPANGIVIIGCVFLVTSTLPPFGDEIRPGSPQQLNSALTPPQKCIAIGDQHRRVAEFVA